MSIKNVIFDFGGVLIDWNPKYLYENVFKDKSEMEFFLKNICTPQWNLKQDAGYSLSEATKELQIQYPRYRNEIEMFYRDWERMLGGEIIENTRLIKPLKTKYRLFGLTNWSAVTFPVAFERYSFFKDLEGIVVSGKEKMVKPDKEIYELILTRYGLKANESLFIDDNLNNIITAKEMGFFTIHIDGELSLNEQLIKLGLL
jgi:2-haloacid dehalogenase